MGEGVAAQLLTLVVGAIVGIAGTTFKGYYDRRLEFRRELQAVWLNTLTPLQVAAGELRGQLAQAFERVFAEREIPESELRESYNLRYWFRQCKDYVVVPSERWPDDQRLEHFAMHSGGMGTEAASTLYITARYLFFATSVRARPPYVGSRAKASQLRGCLDAVRDALERIDFYPVTQDSTGVSMRSGSGDVMNYREFGEALTDRSRRGWFLTLTDVYFKLHRAEPERVHRVLSTLDALAGALKP